MDAQVINRFPPQSLMLQQINQVFRAENLFLYVHETFRTPLPLLLIGRDKN